MKNIGKVHCKQLVSDVHRDPEKSKPKCFWRNFCKTWPILIKFALVHSGLNKYATMVYLCCILACTFSTFSSCETQNS